MPNQKYFKRSIYLLTGASARNILSALLLPVFLLSTAIVNVWAQDIRVGIVTDQTGINSDVSRDYVAGARTYFDHINSLGGIKGHKISVLVKDDEGNATNTVKLTRELIEKEKADVLFGYMGDEGLQALANDSVFKASKITLFAPLSGVELVSGADHIYFVRPTYRDEAKHIIQHFSPLGNARFAVIAINNSFGTTIASEMGAQLKARGLTLTNSSVLNADLKNIDAINRELSRLKPQVIVIAADTISTAEFLKRFRPLNKGVNIVGFSTVNHRTLIELATPDFAAGAMLTQVVPHPDANTTKLQSEHRTLMKKYRDEPPSHVTLEGFLAAKGLVRALERSGLERSGLDRSGRDLSKANIAAALAGEKRFDLEGMTLVFTPKNDRGSNYVDLTYLRKSGRLIQ